jgi:hypothetical protein
VWQKQNFPNQRCHIQVIEGGGNETEVKINRSWLAAYIEILGF